MSEMSEIIKESLDGIKTFADVEKIIGNAINTPCGVTIIPISKLSVGFIGAGFDYGQKKITQTKNFGGGSGTGVSVIPIAFLTITPDASINIITLDDDRFNADRLFSLIERSPEIIKQIKTYLS